MEKRNPAGAGLVDKARNRKSTKPPTKIQRVAIALASGRSFNRFEASRELGDWCIHSTVCDIQNRYGVQVHRVLETVPGRHGNAHVCRYRLLPLELQKARQRLAGELVAAGIYDSTITALSALEAGHGG